MRFPPGIETRSGLRLRRPRAPGICQWWLFRGPEAAPPLARLDFPTRIGRVAGQTRSGCQSSGGRESSYNLGCKQLPLLCSGRQNRGAGPRFMFLVCGMRYQPLLTTWCGLLFASMAASQVVTLEGKPVSAAAITGENLAVLVFIRSDCPVSNRYAPEIQRLSDRFAPYGARFWLVYLDRSESTPALRESLRQHAYRLPALRDPDHTLVRLSHAEITPEAAVFSGGKLVYHGRIDDRWVDFGKARSQPTQRDLDNVLQAVLAGKPAPESTAPGVGCYISDLK
jgi:AhpC/TSA family